MVQHALPVIYNNLDTLHWFFKSAAPALKLRHLSHSNSQLRPVKHPQSPFSPLPFCWDDLEYYPNDAGSSPCQDHRPLLDRLESLALDRVDAAKADPY